MSEILYLYLGFYALILGASANISEKTLSYKYGLFHDFSPHSVNLLYVNEFYIGMSKKFQYLSVSKGHYKASLG